MRKRATFILFCSFLSLTKQNQTIIVQQRLTLTFTEWNANSSIWQTTSSPTIPALVIVYFIVILDLNVIFDIIFDLISVLWQPLAHFDLKNKGFRKENKCNSSNFLISLYYKRVAHCRMRGSKLCWLQLHWKTIMSLYYRDSVWGGGNCSTVVRLCNVLCLCIPVFAPDI